MFQALLDEFRRRQQEQAPPGAAPAPGGGPSPLEVDLTHSGQVDPGYGRMVPGPSPFPMMPVQGPMPPATPGPVQSRGPITGGSYPGTGIGPMYPAPLGPGHFPPQDYFPGDPDLERFTRDYWAPDREAVLARMRGGVPAAPAAQSGPFTFSGTPTAEDLNRYFTSRGAGTQETPYWLGKWGELTARGQQLGNPNYAMYRLEHAEALGNPLPPETGGGNLQGPMPVSTWTPPPAVSLAAPQIAAKQGRGQKTGDPIQDALRAQLLQQMQAGNQPIDENALQIRQPYEAARLATTRAQEDERNALAERLYGEGQGTQGNELTQGIQQMAERGATGLAQVKSGLIQHELDARRLQLQSALDLANSIGARKEAADLQRELANLENQYRYAALNQQASLFGQQLAQQGSQFGQDLAYRYANLGQQQGQWNDTYGLQRQQMIDAANRAAMLYGMSG